jgi:hypothetical protein
MVGSMAAVSGCAGPGDVGHRDLKGDSDRATNPFRAWRSDAAGRVQTDAGVVESAIYPFQISAFRSGALGAKPYFVASWAVFWMVGRLRSERHVGSDMCWAALAGIFV